MALPDLIEIVPLTEPVRAEITVPGSKSITNRALILAALADGEVTLRGALWSEDTQIMVESLRKLGFLVNVEPDPGEFCNRTITIFGGGGLIPNGGTETQPLELSVGNAGTAARFLAAFVCLGNGVFRLSGVPRMHERPQAALFSALRELGYRVECEFANEKLPARIYAGENRNAESLTQFTRRKSAPPAPKKCRVSIAEGSQFASALLMCAKIGNWEVEVVGEDAEKSPYVAMTSKMLEAFPKNGGTFQIEPDASSGSYFWAANYLASEIDKVQQTKDSDHNEEAIHSAAVTGISGSDESLAAAAAAFIRAGSETIPSLRGDAGELRRQSRLLQEWAQRAGKIKDFQPPPDAAYSKGAEHEVFFPPASRWVFKRTYPGTFGSILTERGLRRVATPYFYLRRLELMNKVFGADMILESVTRGENSSVIISQPIALAADEKNPLSSLRELSEFMARFNFEPIPNAPFDWIRKSDGVRVSDARPDNFIKTSADIVPIDLVLDAPEIPFLETSAVRVRNWPNSAWQIDENFFKLQFSSKIISRQKDLGDSIMTAIVLAPFLEHEIKFTDLGRLRVQECERVIALQTELTKCGAKVIEEGDTLTVYPSPLHGAEIETYNDHRMAMCFAVLGLKVPGIKIKNPACVKKTFPNFFQKLAAPPPRGLGAEIRNVKSGRKLELDELFAD